MSSAIQTLAAPRGAARALIVLCGVFSFAASHALAGEWPAWRGPHQSGVADETGLVASWSPEGENLIWKVPFIGRSTPVVFDGRVCVLGRTDDAKHLRQETIACYDARDGKLRWQDRWNVYNTTVPFNRVGWASLVADTETGYVFAMGVAGQLRAYDRDGKLVWSYFLGEDFNRISGYGGRTQTPIVDGDQLILSIVNASWGSHAPPRDRYFAFDKRTGEIRWISTPGRYPEDMNTQSVPVTATIGGRRLMINGNADGFLYALDIHTGEKVWEFELSKRGINASVVVDGDVVYAGHGEENIDVPVMGRVVAVNATGAGNVTKTHEIWRIDGVSAGFPSPLLHEGTLYVMDNSANLLAIDKKKGEVRWKSSLGTVGKASPVWADGKIYAVETNGRVHILEPGEDGAKILDSDEIRVDDGRYAEIYGSPAVAYGRIFISTEAGLFCIGDPKKAFKAEADKTHAPFKPAPGEGPAAQLVVMPAELLLRPGETGKFVARGFDAKGRPLGETQAVWTLDKLAGKLEGGAFTSDPARPFQAGTVVAKSGELSAAGRVRVIADLPWSIDFESMQPGRAPSHWVGAGQPWEVRKLEDGNTVLVKLVREEGLLRNALFMGPSTLHDYTIEADVYGHNMKRRWPDIGLIAGGYTLDLMGNHSQLQIRSWTAELRMAQQVPFEWQVQTWYTMKLRVETSSETAVVLGKVWPRDEAEPEGWSIRAEDPLPIASGAPGLIGYSPGEIYFDNIKVTVNE